MWLCIPRLESGSTESGPVGELELRGCNDCGCCSVMSLSGSIKSLSAADGGYCLPERSVISCSLQFSGLYVAELKVFLNNVLVAFAWVALISHPGP